MTNKTRIIFEQTAVSGWFALIWFISGPSDYFLMIIASVLLMIVKKYINYILIPDLVYFTIELVVSSFPSTTTSVWHTLKGIALVFAFQMFVMLLLLFVRMMIQSGKETLEHSPAATPNDPQSAVVTAEPAEPKTAKPVITQYTAPQRTPANSFATYIILPLSLIVYIWSWIEIYRERLFVGEEILVMFVSEILVLTAVMIQISPKRPVSKRYFITWAIVGNVIFAAMMLFVPLVAVYISMPIVLCIIFYNIRLYWLWQKMHGKTSPYDEQENDE